MGDSSNLLCAGRVGLPQGERLLGGRIVFVLVSPRCAGVEHSTCHSLVSLSLLGCEKWEGPYSCSEKR